MDARQRKPLLALDVRRLPEGLHSDGGAKGRYPRVTDTSARGYLLRYMIAGRQRDMWLGSIREISLAQAREDAAEAAHETLPLGWRIAKYADQSGSSDDLRLPQDRIDAGGGGRGRGSPGGPRAHLTDQGRDGPAGVSATQAGDALGRGARPIHKNPVAAAVYLLPKQRAKVAHHAAMPCAEISGFVKTLREVGAAAGTLALLFTILTAARPGEVGGAAWADLGGISL